MRADDDLGTIVRELRDIEAIKRLKSRYCHLVDAGEWDELSDLWAEDAVCDYGFFGSYSGRKEIIDTFFREIVPASSSFNAHMVHNPVIDVHGDTASGSWYLTAQTTLQPRNQAVWVMGIYRDELRRNGDDWQIASLRFEFKYYTPFEEGWAKSQMWDVSA